MTDKSPEGSFLGLRHAVANVGDFSLGFWTGRGRRKVGRHGHDDAHFMFLLSGNLQTSATPASSSFRTPLAFYPAATIHDDQMAGGIGAFLSISVSHELTRFNGAKKLPSDAVLLGATRPQMTARKIVRKLTVNATLSPSELEAHCLDLVSHLWSSSPENTATSWLRRAHEALSDPSVEPPSMQKLSRSLGVHPVHLTRSFRKVYGSTPAAYAREVRLSAAANLLAGGKCSISEVAAQYGFADHSHLTKSLRRAYGVTPSFLRAETTPAR
ncbi:MAG: helix-turn-helix transcriptional regulator [Micropepsaceae bacterium]